MQALIAHTNRSGEDNLRRLEMRLLGAGVTVARTADDLIRYHGKLMIIDRRELYLFGFNLTHLDIEHSRSFGIVTKNRKLVHEAVSLFEADSKRQPYETNLDTFVVSPVNARKQLSSFIKGTRRELLIYDPKISDPGMIRLLEERAKAGVDIRVIGRLTRKSLTLAVRRPHMRLHTRTMIRDGRQAFIGSQSLRQAELDARREVGIAGCVASISDWQSFSDKWAGVLGSQVRYIHMKEAMHRNGEFKHVKKKDRDEILVAATELAIERYAFSVHLSVKTSHFKTLGPGLRDRLKNPVYCCFEGMVLHLLHSSVAIQDRSGYDYSHCFQLFCDSSEEYSCQILKLYHRLRTLDKRVRDRFQCLTFAEDEHFPPLQIADIVAYCRRREDMGQLDLPVLRKLVELLDKNGSRPDPDVVYRADSKGLGYAFLESTS